MSAGDLLVIFGAKYLYLAIPVAAFVYWLKSPGSERRWLFLLGLLALPLAYILAGIAGYFYFLPRPFVVDGYVPLVAHAPNNGFPSGHTLFSAAITAVIFVFNRKLGIALWVVTALVGVSRVLAGVHHVVDICGAILIGLLAAWTGRHALDAYYRKRKAAL